MKIAHLADLHLGHRRYPQRDANGRNQRSEDVLATCRRMFADLATRSADVVLIAGDIFDGPRPAPEAITCLMDCILSFRRACPQVPIIMIEGNHDRSKLRGDESILALYAALGCTVVTGKARWVELSGLSILAVPEWCAHISDLSPKGSAEGYQVMLLHGEIAGVIPNAGVTVASIAPDAIQHAAWDYVALGHWHVTQEVAPRCWYAGSMDYVSSNVWGELRSEAKFRLSGKGYLMADLSTGTVTRIPITGTRPFIDLPAIQGRAEPADIKAQMIANVADIELDGAIVRQKIRDLPRALQREVRTFLDRRWQSAALHFTLDIHLCEEEREIRVGELERMRTASLEELLLDSLSRRELPANIYRADFVAQGLDYFAQATDAEHAMLGTTENTDDIHPTTEQR